MQGKCYSEDLQGSVRENVKYIRMNDVTFLFRCYEPLSCFHKLRTSEDHFQWFIVKESTFMLKRYLFLSSTHCSVAYAVQKPWLPLAVTKVGAIPSENWDGCYSADRLLWKHYKNLLLSAGKRTLWAML